MIRRPPTLAPQGLVVASHPLAAEAGLALLRAGGHAVDAAVAAAAVLAVVEPSASGLGGDAFLLIYDRKDGAVSAINGSGCAPAALTADRFGGASTIPARSPLATTIPGAVSAWEEASYGWGRLDWSELLAPALRLAEEGFPVSWRMAAVLRSERALLSVDPGLAALFLNESGEPLPAGAICRPTALARTLKAVAEEGTEAFYRGKAAERFARGVRDAGGVLTAEDLSGHESDLGAPIEWSLDSRRHRRNGVVGEGGTGEGGTGEGGDLTLLQQPLPSQGIVLPICLGVLEELGPARGARELHREILTARVAFAVRDLFLGDPSRLPVRPEELVAALLAKETHAALAKLVDASPPDRPPANAAGPAWRRAVVAALATAGSASRDLIGAYRNAGLLGTAAAGSDGSDTTYLCCADGEGNLVGLIQSIYHPFGAGYLEPATGIIPNSRAAGFSLDPASVNRLEPGKRPRHTLNSWMLQRHGRPWLVGGTPGAENQITVNLQILRALLAGEPLWPGPAPMRPGKWTQARMSAPPPTTPGEAPAASLPAALEAPRWGFDPLGRVRLESRFPAEVRARLRRAGHEVVRGGPWDGTGFVQAIARLEEGVLLGATDPRGEGIALGY